MFQSRYRELINRSFNLVIESRCFNLVIESLIVDRSRFNLVIESLIVDRNSRKRVGSISLSRVYQNRLFQSRYRESYR